MAKVVKKLELVRETVRSLNARTGMRAGMKKVVLGGDDSGGPVDTTDSQPKTSNPDPPNTSVVQTSNMSGGNDLSVSKLFLSS